MQTRVGSVLEVACNYASGMVIAWLTGLIVFPMFGMTVSHAENAMITLIYTGVSVIRSYAWRRGFVWMHKKGIIQ